MKSLRERVTDLGAELVIVVLGVLLALWADGKAGESRDRAALDIQLASVRSEVRAAHALLEQRLKEWESQAAALKRLAAINSGAPPPPNDSLAYYIDNGLLNFTTFDPDLSALRDLQESGRIPSIHRDKLRLGLARLQEALLGAKNLESVNLAEPQHDFFDPFVIDNFPSAFDAYAAGTGYPASTEHTANWASLRSPRGRGLLSFKYASGHVMKGSWQGLLQRLSAVDAEISAELNE